MAAPGEPTRTRSDRWTGGPARLVGVDLARALAILGMMATHVVVVGTPGVAGVLFSIGAGRASGLFAVLAGLSLGLSTRRTGPGARDRAAARVGVAVRGLLIAVVGLALVSADSPIAVVLPYYGLAFLVVLPALWWPLRRLAVLAGCWLVAAPVVAFALRRGFDLPSEYEQPTLPNAVEHPLHLLVTLLLTGYYPVIGWTGYLLLGLAVSRLDLRSRSTTLRLLVVGAAVATVAWAASRLLLGPLGVGVVIEDVSGPFAAFFTEFYGTVPTDTAWWLAVAAPHSGTPFDLLHTSGTALAVLGLACSLPAAVTRFLGPAAAFGSMPLTVYSLHVLALALHPGNALGLLGLHALVGVLFATAWRLVLGRGPLEVAVGRISGAAARRVRGRPRPGVTADA